MPYTTFPLFGFTSNEDGTLACHCGESSCTRWGKHPAWKYSELEPGQQVPPRPGGGIALLTGYKSGVFVVDTDGPEGDARFHALGEIPGTYTVRTPSGGRHYYFAWPGFAVRTSAGELGRAPDDDPKKGSRVDVRGDVNGFVVLPGSPHRSGRAYEVESNVLVAQAPAWLLAWDGLRGTIERQQDDEGFRPFAVDLETEIGQARLTMGRAACETFEPAVAGSGGSGALWAISLHLVRTLELPLDAALSLLAEFYNPRCEPPWSPRELEHKIKDAATKSDLMPGDVTPINIEARFERARQERAEQARATRSRRVHNPAHRYSVELGQPSLYNKLAKTTANRVLADLSQHEEWAGVLAYDELRGEVVAVDPPTELDAERDGLSNVDATRIANWFAIVAGTSVTDDMAMKCAVAVARKNSFNPIREYLESCTPVSGSIDSLARQALGLSDDLDVMYVRKFLIAAARRGMCPGTKVDTVLTLQGDPGLRKSTFVTALFSDAWSSDSVGSIEDEKGVGEKLAGKWGVELGELKSLRGASPETVLQFLTRRSDRFRGAYQAGNAKDHPRTCVFVATTNDEEILRSAVGAEHRRFWIVAIERQIDINWILAHRDAVWGEAFELAATGEPHWLAEGQERVHHERARVWEDRDPWFEPILTYCTGREMVRTEDVWRHLGGSIERLDPKTRARIHRVMLQLGAKYKPKGKHRVRAWVIPDDVKNDELSPEEATRRASVAAAEAMLKN